MIDYFVSGLLVRSTQIVVNAAVWIIIGCFLASVFRTMLGPVKTRMIFGQGTRYGRLVGWFAGMLLPVCSLGVIPIVRELHRAGVKGGTIVAFGLTAPLFNPISFLYGLTMSDPVSILVFAFAAMVIVTALGLLWDYCFAHERLPEEAGFEATFGLRRSVALIQNTCRVLISPVALFILLGIAGSVLLAVAVPKGAMQAEAEPDKLYAPALMAFFMTPTYTTPIQAMGQIGSMFQHGNSIGAAFSLLILGAGANLGLLCWFVFAFGIKRGA
ncbi:MAG: permease, partial [Planctomycetota bacterium]|nr:permease [Planctomycetota bacterium]